MYRHHETMKDFKTSKKKKPTGIIAYNKGKIGIDILDQMALYETALQKGIKWYQKLAISIFTGIAIMPGLSIKN